MAQQKTMDTISKMNAKHVKLIIIIEKNMETNSQKTLQHKKEFHVFIEALQH